MNQKVLYGLIGILVIAFIGFIVANNRGAQAPSPTPQPSLFASATPEDTQELTVKLGEQNESSQSGIAKLKEVDGKVVVNLELLPGPKGVPQPAHIHTGACPTPGAVKYPLTNVVDGKSETTLDVDLKTLLTELPLAVNVHKSVPQVSVYVSCGDISIH